MCGMNDQKRYYIPCYFIFQTNIDSLNIQIDQFESEIEGLQARRKKLDRDVSCKYVKIISSIRD